MKTNLPAVLDQGLIRDIHDEAQTKRDMTAMRVRQVRTVLEQRSMPCGYPGCSYCDPDYDPSWDYAD